MKGKKKKKQRILRCRTEVVLTNTVEAKAFAALLLLMIINDHNEKY